MEFLDGYYVMDPELDYNECKRREVSYTGALRVPVRLTSLKLVKFKNKKCS